MFNNKPMTISRRVNKGHCMVPGIPELICLVLYSCDWLDSEINVCIIFLTAVIIYLKLHSHNP